MQSAATLPNLPPTMTVKLATAKALSAFCLLLLIIAGDWLWTHRHPRIDAKHDKYLAALREFPDALAQMSQSFPEEVERTRLARTIYSVGHQFGLSESELAGGLRHFAEELFQRGDASALDRSIALFIIGKFPEAEAEAIQAKDKALATGGSMQEAIQALEISGHAAALQLVEGAVDKEVEKRTLEHFRAAAALTDPKKDQARWSRVQWEIASALIHGKQRDEALDVCRVVNSTHEKLVGAENPETLKSRGIFARMLLYQGNDSDAERECRQVLEIRQRLSGPENPDTLKCRSDLALFLFFQGKFSKAEDELRDVIPAQERILGRDHPDTLKSRTYMANLLHALGDKFEAVEQFREVESNLERVLGAEHPETISCRIGLAETLKDMGKLPEAEKEYRALLPLVERLCGAEDIKVFEICLKLAACLGDEHRQKEALEFAKRSLAGFEKVLGSKCIETRYARAAVDVIEMDLEKAGKD